MAYMFYNIKWILKASIGTVYTIADHKKEVDKKPDLQSISPQNT